MNTKRSMKLTIMILAGILIIAVIVTGGVVYSSQPSFCKSCHLMKKPYTTWTQNPHKNVECLKCHEDPGLVGIIKIKMTGIRQVVQYVTGDYDEKFEVNFNYQNCINCHSGSTKYPKAKNIKATSGPRAPKVSHKDVLDADLSCLYCHKHVAHGKNVNAYKLTFYKQK